MMYNFSVNNAFYTMNYVMSYISIKTSGDNDSVLQLFFCLKDSKTFLIEYI